MARGKRVPTAETRPAYRVFISHATADKWMARVLCEKLEAIGVETFRDDRDIDGGDHIPARLRQEIDRADELLVLLTPNSVNRPWVLLEIGAAWHRDMRIVALLYNATAEVIPAILQPRKAIDLNAVDDYLAEVAARLRGEHT
jgi:hypothetical protein